MTIITTPPATANSYATLAQADAYHAGRATVAWAGDDAAKEAALIRATQWLDGRYRAQFPGTRLNGRAQALEWPRYGVTDMAGDAVESDTVPQEITDAVCEAAVHELKKPGVLSPVVTPAQQKVLVGLGDLTWKPLGGGGVASSLPTVTAVEGILSALFAARAGSVTFLARA